MSNQQQQLHPNNVNEVDIDIVSTDPVNNSNLSISSLCHDLQQTQPNISKFINKIDTNVISNYCSINDLSKLSHNKQNALKLMHVNIRSILGNIGK